MGGDVIVEQRKIITVVLASLMVGASARADLMPAHGLDAGVHYFRQISAGRALLYSSVHAQLARLGVGDFDSRWWGGWAEEQAQIEPAGEPTHLHVLADRQNGAGLCLCALLGLGLCKAAPCVKRFSWGGIPAWYHDGGPYQIGHSLALAPDCLGPAPICFLQPEGLSPPDPAPNYGCTVVICLWRKSQFTPAVLAPRGPPRCFSGVCLGPT
jgi:hypothetical protein